MENITSIANLKIAIQLVAEKQKINELQLKEQFNITYEHLNPANLIKRTFKDISSSPHLYTNIMGAVSALATGYLTRKAIVGRSSSLFRKLIGSLIQFGFINLIARYPEDIRKVSTIIFEKIFPEREEDFTNRVN